MNKHKDLPPASQAWANDVDALMEENKQLKEVVRRLCENAGLDFSNPQRGLNPVRDIPANTNPVGQKLSSLADVQIYNVADKQVLSWSQQGQRWLPATLPTPTAGGTVDISQVSYSSLAEGYGVVDGPSKYTYTAAGTVGTDPNKNYFVDCWTTGDVYIGAGDWNNGTGYAMLEISGDLFNRPYAQLSAADYADSSYSSLVVASYAIILKNTKRVILPTCTTATRPTGLNNLDGDVGSMVFDGTLGIPIFWNGTTWVNAVGTAV